MRFVYDDGEAATSVLVADFFQDERELLDSGDDDFLALGDELAKVARAVGVPDSCPHLRELLYGLIYLAIQNHSVGHHDDGVEHRLVFVAEVYEPMRQPCDRERLSAASRMLNQILLPHAVVSRIGEQSAHHIKLVIARPDAVLLVLLHIVLQDVGKTAAGKHFPPQIVGLDAVGIGRVASAVIHPLVKR